MSSLHPLIYLVTQKAPFQRSFYHLRIRNPILSFVNTCAKPLSQAPSAANILPTSSLCISILFHQVRSLPLRVCNIATVFVYVCLCITQGLNLASWFSLVWIVGFDRLDRLQIWIAKRLVSVSMSFFISSVIWCLVSWFLFDYFKVKLIAIEIFRSGKFVTIILKFDDYCKFIWVDGDDLAFNLCLSLSCLL